MTSCSGTYLLPGRYSVVLIPLPQLFNVYLYLEVSRIYFCFESHQEIFKNNDNNKNETKKPLK